MRLTSNVFYESCKLQVTFTQAKEKQGMPGMCRKQKYWKIMYTFCLYLKGGAAAENGQSTGCKIKNEC